MKLTVVVLPVAASDTKNNTRNNTIHYSLAGSTNHPVHTGTGWYVRRTHVRALWQSLGRDRPTTKRTPPRRRTRPGDQNHPRKGRGGCHRRARGASRGTRSASPAHQPKRQRRPWPVHPHQRQQGTSDITDGHGAWQCGTVTASKVSQASNDSLCWRHDLSQQTRWPRNAPHRERGTRGTSPRPRSALAPQSTSS